MPVGSKHALSRVARVNERTAHGGVAEGDQLSCGHKTPLPLTPDGLPVRGFETLRDTIHFDRMRRDSDAARQVYATGSGSTTTCDLRVVVVP